MMIITSSVINFWYLQILSDYQARYPNVPETKPTWQIFFLRNVYIAIMFGEWRQYCADAGPLNSQLSSGVIIITLDCQTEYN